MGWVASLAVAATVAGQAVSEEQVAHWAGAVGGERQAFAFLVRAAWIEQEARERGVVVSAADAREAADAPRGGLTRGDMVYRARIELLTAGIQEQIATPAARSVTPEQVDAYVDANPRLLPERRRVRVLRARTRRAAAAARRKIAKGLTWRAAARRYGAGGREEVVEGGEYLAGVERRMFRARRGELVRYRSFVFKVTKIVPERPMPRAQQEAMAWEQLASEAQERAIAQFKVEHAAKWRALTVCAPAYAAEPVCPVPAAPGGGA